MPNVYVVGAKIQTGGARMAYHIGRLIADHFGYTPFDVHLYDVDQPLFSEEIAMKTVSPIEMERTITDEDILVCNPSFSQFLFGPRLRGKKLMYVQDFRTFLLLDCHFDLYVSVSQLVARYVAALYGIETPVIPACIEPEKLPVTPWQERPEGSALVYVKNPSREHKILLDMLRRRLPNINLSNVIEGRDLPHAEFMRRMGEVRYFVNLSLAEGFGLVPLEAMAMGCCVTGVDGLAGVDYMKSGENCLTGSIKDLRALPAIMERTFGDSTLAAQCAEAGKITASHYGYEKFKESWLALLTNFIGRAPHGA